MSAELKKSQFVRRLSSVRPSVTQLTWDPMGGAAKISKRYSCKSQPKGFKLFLFFPNGPNAHKTTFGIFEILNIEILTFFFSFSLTWDPMRANISKRYSSYQLQSKVFKVLLNFFPNGPNKNTLGIFKIFEN